MSEQLEMFTTTCSQAGERTRPAIDTPKVALAKYAPDTSRAAAKQAKPKSGKQREVVLFWIRWAGKCEAKGMTCDEVAVLLDLPAQSVSARINGLHNDDYIVDSGIRRNTRYGRKAIVWVAC
jgi:hypothetical protein